MSKLSKWLPFKFKRRKKREEQSEAESGPVSVPVRTAPSSQFAPMTPMSPMSPVSQMFDWMLSDRFWRSPMALLDEVDRHFFGDFTPRTYMPSVDIVDEGKHLRVTAELPGLDHDDVEISVQEGLLILQGEKQSKDESEEEGCYRVERYFGRFQRAIPLPSDVDTSGAEAKFDKGVLTIRLPKASEARAPQRIPIS